MIELFSDIFAMRENFLTGMDARVKLFLAVELLGCVASSHQMIFPLSVLAFCIMASLAVKVPWRFLVLRLVAPTGMVLVLIALQSILLGKTPLWTLPIGPWKLIVTREGLAAGTLCGARVFGAVSVMFLFSLVTPAHKIFHALRWCKVPKEWVEIAMLMYRYIFALIDFISDVMIAQKIRLGYLGIKRSVRSMGEMMGTVLIRSFDQAMRTHDAMVLRGYTGELRLGVMAPLRRLDWGLWAVGSLALVSCFVLSEWRLT